MQMTETRFVTSDMQLLVIDKLLCATDVCNMIICEIIFHFLFLSSCKQRAHNNILGSA